MISVLNHKYITIIMKIINIVARIMTQNYRKRNIPRIRRRTIAK